MGAVHFELSVMLITTVTYILIGQGPMGGYTGHCYPFHNSPEIRTHTQYPGLSSGGAGADHVKIPVSYLGPVAYNRGSCPFNPCRFRHICEHYGGPHPQANCPSQK